MAYVEFILILSIIIAVDLCTAYEHELVVRVEPSQPKEGVPVTMRCFVPTNTLGPHTAMADEDPRACHVVWNRTSVLEGGRRIQHKEIHLKQFGSRDRTGESLIFIPAMSVEYEGLYTCRAVCPGQRARSTTLHLKVHTDNILDEPGMYASIAAFAAVFLLLIGTTLCAISDRRKRHRRQSQRRYNQSLLHQGAVPRESGDHDVQLAFADPPPRYSTVIVMPPSESPQSNANDVIGRASILSSSHYVRTLSVESHGSVFLVPSYDEALKYLERNGLKVDTKSLEPVPPRYSEIDVTDSRQHTESQS